MQPVHCCMSARVAASMSGSAITSETAKRPPGRRTRAASSSTCGLSADRLITQLEITTSTDVVGERDLLDVSLDELDVRHAGLGGVRARPAPASRRSCRVRWPCRWAHPARGDEHVGAGARAEVENRLSLVEVGHGRGHAASQRRLHGGLGARRLSPSYRPSPNTSLPCLSVEAMSWPQPAMASRAPQHPDSVFAATPSRRRRSGRARCSRISVSVSSAIRTAPPALRGST